LVSAKALTEWLMLLESMVPLAPTLISDTDASAPAVQPLLF